MTNPRHKDSGDYSRNESVDPVSERLAVVVAAWIGAVLLLPLHVLIILGVIFTDIGFGLLLSLILFGLPLVVVDIVAFRWFRDNYSVFRWINRSDEARRRRSGRQ